MEKDRRLKEKEQKLSCRSQEQELLDANGPPPPGDNDSSISNISAAQLGPAAPSINATMTTVGTRE